MQNEDMNENKIDVMGESEQMQEPVQEEVSAGSELSAENEPSVETTEEKVYSEGYEINKMKAAVEAILFALGSSVSIERLSEVLEIKAWEVQEVLDALMKDYAKKGRGIEITELDGAVQLCTKQSEYEYLVRVVKNPQKFVLTDSVLETLSIIAYKQPITRGEIEKIRGVSCDHAMNKLMEYDLIEEIGRLDAPGRPILFGTTEQFLRSFGVKNLTELPEISPELMEEMKMQAESEIAGASEVGATEENPMNMDI